MTTLERIKEYIDNKGITKQKFEIAIGYSNGAFGSQLKNNKTIGSDKLEKILTVYSDLNPQWLLTGQGEMLKSAVTTTVVQENSTLDYKELADARKETIESQREVINSKNEHIQLLNEQIAQLKAKLSGYESQESARVAG